MNHSQFNFLGKTSGRLRAFGSRFSARLSRLNSYAALTVLLAIFALWPLLAPGYFYGAHDGRHSIFYVSMFDEAIRDGALWPRWAMHHNAGYGYPTFIVQAPLAFYAAEFFVVLGFGVTAAVKLTWAVGSLVGGWGMYLLIGDWRSANGDWDRDVTPSRQSPVASRQSPISNLQSLPALIAALLYIFIPYHLLDIYVRAALAETTLMAWFPWVFLAFDQLIVGGGGAGWQRRLLLAALSYAGLILTHVVALIAFTPLLIAFVLFRLWSVLPRFTFHVSRFTKYEIRNTKYEIRALHPFCSRGHRRPPPRRPLPAPPPGRRAAAGPERLHGQHLQLRPPLGAV